MGAIPDWALVHTVEVEPHLGRTATGPTYGPPETHRCLITDKRQLVRAADGRQIVASHSLHLAPGPAADIPLDSRITVRGRVTVAVSVAVRDGGELPTPDHVLVMCE